MCIVGSNVLGELLMELRYKLTNPNPSDIKLQTSNSKLERIENQIFYSDEERDNTPKLRQPNQLIANLSEENPPANNDSEGSF